MDSNDFGGKIVAFGNNICRNGKEGGKGGPSGCITAPKSLACVLWKCGHIMLTCVGLSTFSKDWKRTNESKPGEKDGKSL